MRLFWKQKFMSFTQKTTLSGITACSITLFTPTFQYFYTDISAISVTFHNSETRLFYPAFDHFWIWYGLTIRSLLGKASSEDCSYAFHHLALGRYQHGVTIFSPQGISQGIKTRRKTLAGFLRTCVHWIEIWIIDSSGDSVGGPNCRTFWVPPKWLKPVEQVWLDASRHLSADLSNICLILWAGVSNNVRISRMILTTLLLHLNNHQSVHYLIIMCWISVDQLFLTWRSSDDYLMIIYWCLHPLTTITLHQVFRLQLRCEHSRVLSFILGARWENWGISGDFLKYVYSISLNAYYLSINVFQPECVVSDMDPLKLLRTICSLLMGS